MVARTAVPYYYRSITLDQPASDLTDFPVLFSGTFTYLKTVANGGKVNNANGYDITFYSDEALTTLLDFERVFWDGATGTVEFWVKVPTLASASATVIYLSYGNPLISTDQQDAANVWTNDFACVYHLPDGTTLTSNDSTAANLDLTPVGSPVAASGKIDGAGSFDGSGEALAVTSVATAAILDITMSAWVFTSTANQIGLILFNGSGATDGYGILHSNLLCASGTDVAIILGNVSCGTITTAHALSTNQWVHIVVTRDSGGTWRLYLDGAVQTGTSTQSPNVPTGAFSIGGNPDGSTDWIGSIDEVRICEAARSATWILTEYNNQNDPANFYAVGDETFA